MLSGYAAAAALSWYAVHELTVRRGRDWVGLAFAELGLWLVIGILAVKLLLVLGVLLAVPPTRRDPLLFAGVLSLAVAVAGSLVASQAWTTVTDSAWVQPASTAEQRPLVLAAVAASLLPAVVSLGALADRRWRRPRG